jgi:hypothetical protein
LDKLRIAFLLLAFAAFPTAAPAQTAGEVSGDAQLQKAYDDAFAAMLADPQNLDKTFAFAELAGRKGDFEGAISALERMLFIDPDLPRVKLELGTLYYRLQSYETARTYLQGALESPAVPPPVRDRAQSFLNEIDKRSSQHRINGWLMFGGRGQSNATQAPSGTAQFNFLGLIQVSAPLSSQFTKKGDFDLFASANAKYIYDFDDQNQNSFEITGSYYGNRQRNQTQVNVTYFELTAGPRVPIPSGWLWDGAVASVRPYAIFTYVDLKDDPFYRAPGAGFEVLTQVIPGTVVQLNLEGRDKRYQDSVDYPLLKDQNGSEILARMQVTQQITDELAALVSGTILKLNARNGSQGYRYYDYTLGLSYNYDAPFNLTEQSWNVTGAVTRGYYIYDQPDVFVNPDSTRYDRDWRFSVVGAVPVADDVTIIGTLGRTIRQSSIENFVFNNNYVTLAAQWRF